MRQEKRDYHGVYGCEDGGTIGNPVKYLQFHKLLYTLCKKVIENVKYFTASIGL
jgi:hypothetical protein